MAPHALHWILGAYALMVLAIWLVGTSLSGLPADSLRLRHLNN
jgi:hypothetical protein